MRFRLKFGCWRFGVILTKTRWAYGLSSKLKNGKHLLLLDVDSTKWSDVSFAQHYLISNELLPYFCVRTDHGFHMVVWHEFSRKEVDFHLTCLSDVGLVDRKWVDIGRKRGYWFLETKYSKLPDPIPHENLNFMRIERSA